jgi:ABC-type uncharacterized transport system permease subunit
MMDDLAFGLWAVAALFPVSLAVLRREAGRDWLYWVLLAVAVAGPVAWVMEQTSGEWRTGFSVTLWVTIAASLCVFSVAAAVTRHAWRLTPLVGAYMIGLGILAVIWQHAPKESFTYGAATGWVHLHILVSVVTYALVTVAGVAALAAFLQERALKARHPTALTRGLPSVADSEVLLVRLLAVGEAVLAVGMASGMAIQFQETGALLAFDHKTVLSIVAFAVIGGLLIAHYRTGVRGRMAARFVLVAYLLLTLGYPGVKFVTEVLIG